MKIDLDLRPASDDDLRFLRERFIATEPLDVSQAVAAWGTLGAMLERTTGADLAMRQDGGGGAEWELELAGASLETLLASWAWASRVSAMLPPKRRGLAIVLGALGAAFMPEIEERYIASRVVMYQEQGMEPPSPADMRTAVREMLRGQFNEMRRRGRRVYNGANR